MDNHQRGLGGSISRIRWWAMLVAVWNISCHGLVCLQGLRIGLSSDFLISFNFGDIETFFSAVLIPSASSVAWVLASFRGSFVSELVYSTFSVEFFG